MKRMVVESEGFGFRVSSFGFRVSGFGFRVSGFGFRVSGFVNERIDVGADCNLPVTLPACPFACSARVPNTLPSPATKKAGEGPGVRVTESSNASRRGARPEVETP